MMTTARPPPARPHIGIRSPARFENEEWGEDDAWDSGSDSESPQRTSWSTSVPKPVPRKSRKSSSSSQLAFSYTQINAPNPSSYPPRMTTQPSDWTIVQHDESAEASREEPPEEGELDPPVDVDGDLVLGDLESEIEEDLKAKPVRNAVRVDAENIVLDPLHAIRLRTTRSQSPTPSKPPENYEKSEKLMRERSIRTNRKHKCVDCLTVGDVNMAELRKLAWAGVPNDLRPVAWQMLLGYLPLNTQSRLPTLSRKRGEYLSLVEVAFARDRDGLDQQIWHQIEIDVPRTRPGVRLWMHGATQRSLERILYVWALRHPASGYVQGINDLVTPFFQVFLSAYIDTDPEEFDPGLLSRDILNAIEADTFWCLSRLLDGIQDNYIFAQPGIQRSVKRMAELVARIDAPLSTHLESQGVEFMQFAFRWMNCLLMREISVTNTIRMWDTYLAEGTDAFSQFHLYVCSAFLVRWSDQLKKMDFQGIIMFLQSLPTQGWGDHEIEMLLSEAFVLNSIWHNAQSHFS